MSRTSLNEAEREILMELYRDVKHIARGFVGRKVGVSASAEWCFDDAWNDAMVAIGRMMIEGKWNFDRPPQVVRAHVCWLCVSWYRRRHWQNRCNRVELTEDVLMGLFQGEKEPAEPFVSVRFEVAMDCLSRMRPAKSLYLYELMELVKGGDCPIQCFHSGMVKKLHQHMKEKGIERQQVTLNKALRRARDELWAMMVDAGVVRGERPKIDRQTAGL